MYEGGGLLMKKVNISSIVKEQMNTKEQYNYMPQVSDLGIKE